MFYQNPTQLWGYNHVRMGTEATLRHQFCEDNVKTNFKTCSGAWEKGTQRTENQTTFENQPAFPERGQGGSSDDPTRSTSCSV